MGYDGLTLADKEHRQHHEGIAFSDEEAKAQWISDNVPLLPLPVQQPTQTTTFEQKQAAYRSKWKSKRKSVGGAEVGKGREDQRTP